LYINGYTKALGAVCIASVLCAMYSGALAVGVLMAAGVPLALVCRRKMDTEEQDISALLERRKASCTFRCNCFEGFDGLAKGDPCTLFFVRKGIEIDCGGDTHLIALSQIQALDLYALPELLEVARSERRFTLGALGEAVSSSVNRQDDGRVRKQKNVRYLVIKLPGRDYLSFFSSAEHYRYNTLGTRKDPAQYLSERKKT
jgi:hypothetical protein